MQTNIIRMSLMAGVIITLSACGKTAPVEEQIKDTANAVQQKAAEVKEGTQKFTGSMKDIMAMGGAMKCTWKDEDGSAGIAYIDGEKVNSKVMNMPVGPNGEIGEAYVISDGEWMYMWSSLSPQGTKMKMDPEMMSEKEMPELPEGVEMPAGDDTDVAAMDVKMNYECDKWSSDGAMFVPPTDVTFTDMNAMMQQMMPSAGSEKAPDMTDMKQMCNMLSGQDKADCEAQF